MSLAAEHAPPAAPAAPTTMAGERATRLLQYLTAAEGAGFTAIVGYDGSPLWRVIRVLLVVTLTGVAWYAYPRLRVLARGGLALFLGTVGAAAGGAVGLRFLTKAGLTVPTVAGLLAMLAGLGLLATAGMMLFRHARRWWKLLAVPVAAAVLLLGHIIVPAVVATNVPPIALGAATPAQRGLPYSDVTIRTGDDVRLSGWYVPARNRSAVVLLHGSGSTRTETLGQAAVLARHGYGVLLLDARGHGDSGGRGMDFGWYGDADIAAAVTYLQQRPDVDPRRVGAVGLSMGGEEAVGAAASDPRIRAVVAEGVEARTAADKSAWLPGGVAGTLQRGADAVSYWLTDLLTGAGPPISLRAAAAAAAPRPILLIAAGNSPDEARAAAAIRAAAPATVAVWVVPGAGHTGGLAARPAQWAARVTDFLEHALGSSGP